MAVYKSMQTFPLSCLTHTNLHLGNQSSDNPISKTRFIKIRNLLPWILFRKIFLILFSKKLSTIVKQGLNMLRSSRNFNSTSIVSSLTLQPFSIIIIIIITFPINKQLLGRLSHFNLWCGKSHRGKSQSLERLLQFMVREIVLTWLYLYTI